MTTSESKSRFFNKTNRLESIRITNRIESIRIANWNALVLVHFQQTFFPRTTISIGFESRLPWWPRCGQNKVRVYFCRQPCLVPRKTLYAITPCWHVMYRVYRHCRTLAANVGEFRVALCGPIAEIFWRVNSADYARCDVFAPQIRLCWPLCAFRNYIYLLTYLLLCRSGVTRVLGARGSTGVALKCALPERGRTGN